MVYGRIALTPTALLIPDGIDQSEWNELGKVLFALEGKVSWWIGDYAVYGERTWKYTYDALAKAHEMEIETVHVYASVARSIKPLTRNQGLSFAHHRLIQALDPDDQKKWLDLAVEKGWTVQQMAVAMKPVRQSRAIATPYDELFQQGRFPDLKMGAVKKLVMKAKSDDKKALEELAEVVRKTEQWLDDLRALFQT